LVQPRLLIWSEDKRVFNCFVWWSLSLIPNANFPDDISFKSDLQVCGISSFIQQSECTFEF